MTNLADVRKVFETDDITGVVVALGGKTADVGKTMLTDGNLTLPLPSALTQLRAIFGQCLPAFHDWWEFLTARIFRMGRGRCCSSCWKGCRGWAQHKFSSCAGAVVTEATWTLHV